ncbi:MAG: ChaN family lipoprotein [Bdellovibrio sp.]|nr:ChaN family lipoprotein [Bdellovibrio sp.]
MTNISFKSVTLPLFLSLTLSLAAKAQLFQGDTLKVVQPSAIFEKIKPGSVVILGESHGLAAHRDQHVQVLNGLRQQGFKVSVGMEFFNYPDQTFVNQYLTHELNDEQFLTTVAWAGFDFQFYKQQILFPDTSEGATTIALNIPRFVTSKIAKTGLESLTSDEQKLMPPNFQVGRDSYKQRFTEIMHVPPGPSLDRYFIAQSTWDDTMAWNATAYMKLHPDQVLVIVVGDFHAQFGGGLANRILARAPETNVVIVSQIWAANMMNDGTTQPMTDDEIKAEITPSPIYGPRGDFVWVSRP